MSKVKAEETTRSLDSLTGVVAVVGTLHYMPPEALCGEPADARSDIWALGVVLHEMAAGELPFRGQPGFEVSGAILNQPPGPLPTGVPAGLKAVIGRCLAKAPEERYQRAEEVRAALETL
jgi:serine/threonine-protein kinase